ncbi:MAG: acetyl-CoA C-acyltransferase [Gammaproteobacteria bacterium]
MNDVVIIAGRRTPLGSYQGALSRLTCTQLGAAAIKAVVDEVAIAPDAVDEVIMGCVLPAGLGQAPARQAALQAGLSVGTPCTTVNKVCGSGMKAMMLAHDAIVAGTNEVVVAGGMESMSNAPYLVSRCTANTRPGHQRLVDHLFYDGLENPDDGRLMGQIAERCAERYEFSRDAQDAYAIESIQRAQQASRSGAFAAEIVEVEAAGQRVSQDEPPFKAKPDRVSKLRPVFQAEHGTITAASSSSLADGAAALLLMRRAAAERYDQRPLARVVAHATHACVPTDFPVAPIHAIRTLYEKTGWRDVDIDLYEINEAFAVVAMAAIQDLGISHAKVNVLGGACALGHPLGATGARILVTLLHALRRRNLRRGIAALCIGGGEATAVAVEREAA